jgi:uncharacterized membrane protein
MTSTKLLRSRVPLAMIVIGTVIALAAVPHSGPSGALVIEAFSVAAAFAYYVLGRRDTDTGALVGSRADERQATIALRASAFSGRVMALAAIVGFVVQTARGASTWPFALFAAIGAISFIAGIGLARRA